MKEEWIFPGAVVPVDVETTAALVVEIKRLIDVVGGMALMQPAQQEYERGFIDGMQEQMKRSVDRAVNAMAQRTWVSLTDEEIARVVSLAGFAPDWVEAHIAIQIVRTLEAKLKEKNT